MRVGAKSPGVITSGLPLSATGAFARRLWNCDAPTSRLPFGTCRSQNYCDVSFYSTAIGRRDRALLLLEVTRAGGTRSGCNDPAGRSCIAPDIASRT